MPNLKLARVLFKVLLACGLTFQMAGIHPSVVNAARMQSAAATFTVYVSDSSTLDAVEAVLITINTTPDAVANMTGENGECIFTDLAPGTYTITAQKDGYQTAVISDVVLVDGDNRVEYLNMNPAMSLSGTIKDAAHGYGLYSKVEITGGGHSASVFTDINGYYYFTEQKKLYQGIDYTLKVTVQILTGYPTTEVELGDFDKPAVIHDVFIQPDLIGCTAPGYQIETTPITNFDAVTPPALPSGWQSDNVPGADSPAWMTSAGPAHSLPNQAVFNGSGLAAGSSARLSDSTSFTYADTNSQVISFWMWTDNIEPAGVDSLQPQIFTDDGETWTDVDSVFQRYDAYPGWKHFRVDLSHSIQSASTSFKIGFKATSSGDGEDIVIDDVGFDHCVKATGGLVLGRVIDGATSHGLPGSVATSSNGAWTHVIYSDPDDVQFGDAAFFGLFLPSGQPIDLTVQNWSGYKPFTYGSLGIAKDTHLNLLFPLDAAHVSASSTNISTSVRMGDTTSIPISLSNTGNLETQIDIMELPGPSPLLPTAGTILAQWDSGISHAWGISPDRQSGDRVWISSPGPGPTWGGDGSFSSFDRGGEQSLEKQHFSWSPTNGPADMAYDDLDQTFWVMNVDTGAKNCIYEVDPATGSKKDEICPGGDSGFAISQRGLAYDPYSNTFLAGGWNDTNVYRFDRSGKILGDYYTGLPIAGMAFNPDTGSLFVTLREDSNRLLVLDTLHGFTVKNEIYITGLSEGGGAGLEMDCDGSLWMVDKLTGKVFHVESGERSSMCTSPDLDWLSVNPSTRTTLLATDNPLDPTTEDFSITLNPGAEHTPGTVLNGILRFMTNSPEMQVDIPVQMTVTAPSDWGSVEGLVIEKDRCDQTSGPSIGAQVNLYSDAGRTHLAGSQLSDEHGKYSISLPKGGYFLSVVKNGYVSGSDLPVQIDSAQATSQDAALRLDAPCVTSKSASLDEALLKDKATSLELELENSGAGSGSYDLTQVEPAADWLTFTPKSGSISAGGDARVAVTFDSTGMPGGDYSTGVDLQVDGAPVIHIPVTLKVMTYSLELAGVNHQNDLPGAEVTYTLYVKDTGSQAGNYEVDVDAGKWSADASVASISLTAGETGDLTIHVQIPPGAAWGDKDDTLVTVRSSEDERESLNITLTTTAGAPPDWGTLNGTVSGILRCGTSSTPLEGVLIEITKTGDATPYTTRLTGIDGKFSLQLPPGAYKLVATKDHFTSSAALSFNISGPAAPTAQDVSIDSDESCITADLVSLDRTMLNSKTAHATIKLSNLGPAAGSFTVSKTGGENDWLTYSPVSGAVIPGGHTDLLVDFDTTGLVGGNYSSNLLISLPNQPDGITIPVALRVNSYGLSLLPALDTRQAVPGSTVAYFLEATNTGNQSETFEVAIEGGSWSVDAPDTIQIDTGETGFVTIWVTIPAGAPLGASEQITVTFTSRSDPRVSKQSVFTTTAVEDKQVKVFIPLVVK